jgi:hypothetical protein
MKGVEVGSLAEWFAAIGTISAVFVAIWAATLEARKSRKRDLFSQANSVAACPISFGIVPKNHILITNNSNLPIYDVLLSYGVSYGAGPTYQKGNKYQVFIRRIPHGEFFSVEPKNLGKGMHTQNGISISFRDSRGVFWRRDARGMLVKTKGDPFEEMEIVHPVVNWTNITPTKSIGTP